MQFPLGIFFLAAAAPLFASTGIRPAVEIRLTKITDKLISSPQFSYTGAEQYQTNQRERWLEVEVEFTAPAPADEATFKYYILLGEKLLMGEVTHTNILPGRALRSVMYVPPHTLARVLGVRSLSASSVQNIAVQVLIGGNLQDELSLHQAAAQWFANLPRASGEVLNKNETPFAALYWDRYEQIKAGGGY